MYSRVPWRRAMLPAYSRPSLSPDRTHSCGCSVSLWLPALSLLQAGTVGTIIQRPRPPRRKQVAALGRDDPVPAFANGLGGVAWIDHKRRPPNQVGDDLLVRIARAEDCVRG